MNHANHAFDIEADENGVIRPAPPLPPQAPPAAAAAEGPPPARRRGRRPRVSPGPSLAAVKPLERIQPDIPIPIDYPNATPPRDPYSTWTRLYQEWINAGRNPEDIRIHVERVAQGNMKCDPVPILPHLNGAQLGPDVNGKTAGDVLDEHLRNYCHRGQGPATYKVKFVDKNTGLLVRAALDMPLEAWQILDQRVQEQVQREQQRMMGGIPMGRSPYMSPGPMGYMTSGQMPAPMDPTVKALLAEVNEARKELASLKGQPPPAPVQVPQAASSSDDEDDAFFRKLERYRRIGEMFAPKHQEAASVEQQVMTAIVKLQEAGVIPKTGGPAQIGAQGAAVGPAPGSIEAILDAEAAKRKLESKIRQAFPNLVDREEIDAAKQVMGGDDAPLRASRVVPNPTDPDNPLRWPPLWNGKDDEDGQEGVPKGPVEWAMRFAAENPKIASQVTGNIFSAALETLAKHVPDKLGEMMSAFAKRGGEAAAAATLHAANGSSNGWAPQA